VSTSGYVRPPDGQLEVDAARSSATNKTYVRMKPMAKIYKKKITSRGRKALNLSDTLDIVIHHVVAVERELRDLQTDLKRRERRRTRRKATRPRRTP
jgi:hypothetical protein